jgi:hypothetical protein
MTIGTGQNSIDSGSVDRLKNNSHYGQGGVQGNVKPLSMSKTNYPMNYQ